MKRFWLIILSFSIISWDASALKPLAAERDNDDRAELMKAMNIFRVKRPIEAPDFELRSLTGDSVRLRHYRGKFILINFWTSW